MFFESSKDILYLVLAFCVLWITIFLSWLLYALVAVVRDINEVMEGVKHKLQTVENFFLTAKSKLDRSTAHLFLIAELVKQLVMYLTKRARHGAEETRDPKEKNRRRI